MHVGQRSVGDFDWLFSTTNLDDKKDDKSTVSENILNGKVSLLFCHPESFLCEEGRAVLKSSPYIENVSVLW